MSNNSSGFGEENPSYNDPCVAAAASGGSYWLWRNLGWYIYTGVQVVYFFGFIGNVLSLLAFRKQCKIDSSYYHQLSIIVSDLLSIVANVLAECGYVYLYVYDQAAPDFIQKTYLLRFFAWCYAFADMAATASLIVMNGACVDRVYALYQPVKYNSSPKKKLALGLFILAHTVGVLTNLHDVIAKKIIWNESKGFYILILDGDTMGHPFVIFLSNLLIIMRGILLLTLFVLGFVISQKYRKVYSELQDVSMMSTRPVSEKALTHLMLAQSTLALGGLLTSIVYDIATSVVLIPWCADLAFILELVEAVAIAIQQSANCLIYMGISKKFRQAIMAVIKCQELTDGVAGNQPPSKQSGPARVAASRRGDMEGALGNGREIPGMVAEVD